MNLLTAIIDALVRFVQRNPLTVLVLLILAVGAPAVLKGVAIFFLYLIMGIILLAIGLILFFRWKMKKIRRQMEEQFGEGFDPRNFNGQGFGTPYDGASAQECEGEVKVRKTPETPEKRVSKDIGDYVEFEETKEK